MTYHHISLVDGAIVIDRSVNHTNPTQRLLPTVPNEWYFPSIMDDYEATKTFKYFELNRLDSLIKSIKYQKQVLRDAKVKSCKS